MKYLNKTAVHFISSRYDAFSWHWYWLAFPNIANMASPRSPLEFTVDIKDVSLIGSSLGLGALCGNIFFGLMAARIGREQTCIL